MRTWIKGMKAGMVCHGRQFHLGVNKHRGRVKMCASGIHASPTFADTLGHGPWTEWYICEGNPVKTKGDKAVFAELNIIRRLPVTPKTWLAAAKQYCWAIHCVPKNLQAEIKAKLNI